MKPFTTLTAIAAPLTIENIDTDMIIPKQFLKTIKRTGLREGLFFEMRFDMNGRPKPDFILNQRPYHTAEILIAGANFGCGSSREHAPWALLDFGIRCIIAPSFADIFYNNCFKNGILPIALPKETVDQLQHAASAGKRITVDLSQQKVSAEGQNTEPYHFDIEPFRKTCLLDGLDDIGLTLQKLGAIADFEQKQSAQAPWLYLDKGSAA